MICSRRSSAAIRGVGRGSDESTFFFNVITGGIEPICNPFSSPLSFQFNIRRDTPLLPLKNNCDNHVGAGFPRPRP
jgi:hypothetical protein